MNLTKFKEQVKGHPSEKYPNTVLFSLGADSAQGVSKLQSVRVNKPKLYYNFVFPSETAEKLYVLSPFLLPLSKVLAILYSLFSYA